MPPHEVRVVREYLETESKEKADAVEYVAVKDVVKAGEDMFDRYPGLFRKLAE